MRSIVPHPGARRAASIPIRRRCRRSGRGSAHRRDPRPLRFKYRRIGTVHVEAGRVEMDRPLARSGASEIRRLRPPSRNSGDRDEGVLAFNSGPLTYVIKKDDMKIERLIMRLARNGRDVDMLLGVNVLVFALDRSAARTVRYRVLASQRRGDAD